MAKEVYEKLRARFAMFPHGFPKTESGIEIDLLKKMYSEDEAAVACMLNLMLADPPESAQAIAVKVDMDANEVEIILESLTKKGLIYGTGDMAQRAFALLPMLSGISEFYIDDFDKETARLFENYLYHEGWGQEVAKAKLPVGKVVPVNLSVPSESINHPYDDVLKIIEKSKSITLMHCLCRTQKNLIGEGCGKPTETCLFLGSYAEHLASIGKGRPITKEEAIEVVKKAADAGCFFGSSNTQDSYTICCCCTCCCHFTKTQTLFSKPDEPTVYAKSDFLATVGLDLCTGCEECVEVCGFAALSIEDEQAKVSHEKCVGCGRCIDVCPVGALSLQRKSEAGEAMPKDPVELFFRMGWRR